MQDISQIDKNFKIETKIDKPDIRFYDVLNAPFQVHGVFYENGRFRRMPEAVAKSVNEGVYALHANGAGGRVRFRTDSPYVAIHAKMSRVGKMPHFALCGSAGFDLYVKNEYTASFVPPFDITDGFEKVVELGEGKMREITIHFPLYSSVDQLYIGLKEGAKVAAPTPYKIEKPIVYYGSSITQGGCASRPGTSYQGFVSRALGADYINLGFSGSARGEEPVGEYIRGLSMSAFVLDYDHNAPTVEHLEKTHERLFLAVRQAQPHLPILLLTRPKYHLTDVEKARLEVVRTTYQNALARGDKNVYFIEGRDLMRLAKGEGTVDGTHPTDLGFFSMAREITKVLKKIL